MHVPRSNPSGSPEAQAIELAGQAQQLRAQRLLAQARVCYEAALAKAPDLAAIRFNYGNLLQAMSDRAGAEAAFRQVLAQDARHLPALVNLARLLPTADHAGEVEQLYRQALSVQPDEPRVLRGLASLLQSQQRLREARPLFERALALQPEAHGFRSDYGVLLNVLDENEAARAQWLQILAANPQHITAMNNLGALARKCRHLDEALHWLERAWRLAPDDAEQRSNNAQVLLDVGRLTEAMSVLKQAGEPVTAAALLVAGFAQVHLGDIAAGMQYFLRSADLTPESSTPLSNALFASLYRDLVTPEQDAQLHHQLASRIQIPAQQPAPLPALPVKSRAQRVGFLSPDFRSHPVACFFLPLLAAFDPERIETVCYSVTPVEDDVTVRIREAAAHWRPCVTLSDAELAAQIRADACDILVDLAGHTASNRLAVFRARPAPVQMTYMGYPATTGLPEMDLLIADHTLLPAALPTGCTEQVVRLDRPWICYEPLAEAPEVAASPCLQRGRIRFGSCNNYPKLSPATIALWAQVLLAVPGSDLRLHALAMADPAVRSDLVARFVRHGVAASRILPMPPVDGQRAILNAYADIDIALEPLPFNGFTTSCDALWMGVPVITLSGQSYRTRVGTALLTALGETELIAQDQEHYVRIARKLAADPAALAERRASRRERFRASPLGDARGLADAFTRLFGQVT